MYRLTQSISEFGVLMQFVGSIFALLLYGNLRVRHIIDQVWQVFIQSLPTTALAGFFVGGILSLQFGIQVKGFGALGYLGGLATSASLREVGPLLIAFMLSAKIGAFTSAELATMRVTEQMDAIRCLGADPLQEIIGPRFFGIVIASFFLLLIGLFASLFGGMLMAKVFAGIHTEEYLRHIPNLVSGVSIFNSVFKCFVFSLILASVCSYRGYTASGGSRGVGRAVVASSVQTMVALVLSDWLTSVVSDAIFLVIA